MSDPPGTLETIATQLAIAIAPLEQAVADPQSFRAFLQRLGWDAQSLPPEWSALATNTGDVVTALEALVAAPGVDAAVRLLEQLGALYRAVTSITSVPSGVDPATFLADIGERIFELLLVDYLTVAQPRAAALFRALGVITDTPHEEVAGRPLYVETRFRFDELANVAANPGLIPQRIYGWGTPDLDFPLIARQLLELATTVDLLAQYGPADPVLAAGLQAPPAQTDHAIASQLSLALIEFDVAGETVQVGLALLEFPAEAGNAPGLILQPLMPSTLADQVQVTPAWTLYLRAGSDIARTFGIMLTPGGIDVRYPFDPGTAPPAEGFGAGLQYATTTPAVLLGQAGQTRIQLGGVRADLTLDITGTDIELSVTAQVNGLAAVIATDDQDSFLGSLFGHSDLTINAPLSVRWSNKRGFAFTGGAGLEVTVAPHVTLGPVTLDTVHLGILASIGSGQPAKLTVTGDASLTGALGPFALVVGSIGVGLDLALDGGNAGPFDVSAGLRGPTGLGASLDAGPVNGGGFLSYDRPSGRYAGVLQLRVFDIATTGIALLDTKLPDGDPGFSLLIIFTAQFPPMQLGYGFTLDGVGGLAAVNRTLAVDAIQAGLRSHSVDHILFPDDPVRNAPQIISDLSKIFPPAAGRYVFGPMANIGWGTPTLISIELGILIEVPAPERLVLLGQVAVTVPAPELAIVNLRIDILGVLDFEGKRVSVDASLHDSTVAGFPVAGDLAFRLAWGDTPAFALAIGGLNPAFQPPPGFPTLKPVTVSLGFDDNPRISVQGYLAVTSNTLQFGALAQVYAAAGGFNVKGWLGFDALFVFSPFSFSVDYSAGMSLCHGSSAIAGVQVQGTLSGPKPWHIQGSASISLLFFSISVPFDATFGDSAANPLPSADPWPPLRDALQDPQSWSAVLPPQVSRVVSLLAPADPGLVLIDPVGGAEGRERVVPLDRPITKFGEATPAGPGQWDVSGVTVGTDDTAPWAVVTDYFARAQFEQLTDAEKISIPSFEPMDAGVAVSSDAIREGAAISTELTYETLIIDSPWSGRRQPDYQLPLAAQLSMVRNGAAARSPLRNVGGAKFANPGAGGVPVLADESYVIAGTDDLRPSPGFPAMTKGDAYLALKLHLAAHPEDRGQLQVLALTEAAA
jgi:hypothetical protein